MIRLCGKALQSQNPMLVSTGIWCILAIPAMTQNNPAKNSTNSVNRSRQKTAPSDEELAKERQNPIAELIQIPIVSNLDFGAAAGNGFQYTLTFQPVIPLKITHDWNLITRPIFSVISGPQSTAGLGRTSGSSDLITQFYFSPQNAKPVIWGFGPVVGMPTGSDPLLGTGKWTLGPGVAIIKQTEHWTFGVLLNHVWSLAGDWHRSDVSLTGIEPTVGYSWGKGWTVSLDDASTYDSTAAAGNRWVQPIELAIGKVIDLGRRPVGLSFGVVPYARAPAGYPSVGLSFTIAPLFPKE
jgi:hypothetical protein